jgi:hypothetical protein
MSLSAPAAGGDESLPIELGDTVRAGVGDHEPEHAVLRSERHRALRPAVRALSQRERLWGDPDNVNPPSQWEVYEDLTEARHGASDHGAVFIDLDI